LTNASGTTLDQAYLAGKDLLNAISLIPNNSPGGSMPNFYYQPTTNNVSSAFPTMLGNTTYN
jgi:hypothetical protein